jgi:2-polyprenyl-3-methyl-5-hydroxy-6-metoxy-1,4-benzoquinol methylase
VQTEDLDRYVSNYTSFNDWLMRKRYEVLSRHFRGDTCLEFGAATGEGTAHLLDHFNTVVAVDGSPQAVANLKQRFATDRLIAVCSYFEDFDTDRRFDTIVLAHVLEHVDNPHRILMIAQRFLQPAGVLIVDVPNAMSLHRQVGVEMGLLHDVTELNEGDISIGHRRVYTPEAFRKEIRATGLQIRHFGGVFLKVVSNALCERTFSSEQLDALLAVGERYPDIAAEMYVVAALKPSSQLRSDDATHQIEQ